MDSDRDQLQILSAFHYILAAFVVLVALVPSIILFVSTQAADPDEAARTVETAGARATSGALFVLAAVALVAGILIATLLVAAGRCLVRGRRRGLCLAAATVMSFFPPFGTVIGLVTLAVLARPSVRAFFAEATP